MIIGIDKELKIEAIRVQKELHQRLALAQQDMSAMLDYLDYLDSTCVNLAVSALPKSVKKKYEAKLAGLLDNLDRIKDREKSGNAKRMFQHAKYAYQKFNKFITLGFFGNESLSDEPLVKLLEAEYSSLVARYNLQVIKARKKATNASGVEEYEYEETEVTEAP